MQIFISYARADSRWFREDSLIPWLTRSLRKDGVELWWDREGILPGDEFRSLIQREIDRSEMAILLVSQEFLNSEFIEAVELPRIKDRAHKGEMTVIPVLLEPCAWEEVAFLNVRQVLPGKPTPLINYAVNERDWANVRAEILAGVRAAARRSQGVRPAQVPVQTPPVQTRVRRVPGYVWPTVAMAVILGAVLIWRHPSATTTQPPAALEDQRSAPEGQTPAATRVLRGHRGGINTIAFTPDGRTMVTGGGNLVTDIGEVLVWDLASGNAKRAEIIQKPNVLGMALSPNGRLVATGGANEMIMFWNLDPWRNTASLKAQGVVEPLAFSPDG